MLLYCSEVISCNSQPAGEQPALPALCKAVQHQTLSGACQLSIKDLMFAYCHVGCWCCCCLPYPTLNVTGCGNLHPAHMPCDGLIRHLIRLATGRALQGPAAPGRYFADLIIAYLQDVLALALLAPAASADPGMRLPPPMFPGNDGAGAAVCLKGEAFRHVVASVQVRPPLWSMRPCRLRPLANVCVWSF